MPDQLPTEADKDDLERLVDIMADSANRMQARVRALDEQDRGLAATFRELANRPGLGEAEAPEPARESEMGQAISTLAGLVRELSDMLRSVLASRSVASGRTGASADPPHGSSMSGPGTYVQGLFAAQIESTHLLVRGAVEGLKARALQGFSEIARDGRAVAQQAASAAFARQTEQALKAVREAREEAATNVETLLEDLLGFWGGLAQGKATGPYPSAKVRGLYATHWRAGGELLLRAVDATIAGIQRALDEAANVAETRESDLDAAAADLTERIVGASAHLDYARDGAIAEMAALDGRLWPHWTALDPARAHVTAPPPQPPTGAYPVVMTPGYGMPPVQQPEQSTGAPSVSDVWQRLVGGTRPSDVESEGVAVSATPAPEPPVVPPQASEEGETPPEATPEPAEAVAEEGPAKEAAVGDGQASAASDLTETVDETTDLIGEQTNLVVYGFESFSTVSWFLRAVQAIDEVRSVRVRRFHRGTLHVMIEHEGVGSLSDRLGRIGSAEHELNLLNVGAGRVEAQLVAAEEESETEQANGAA